MVSIAYVYIALESFVCLEYWVKAGVNFGFWALLVAKAISYPWEVSFGYFFFYAWDSELLNFGCWVRGVAEQFVELFYDGLGGPSCR